MFINGWNFLATDTSLKHSLWSSWLLGMGYTSATTSVSLMNSSSWLSKKMLVSFKFFIFRLLLQPFSMRLQMEVLGAKNPIVRNLFTNRALAPVRWIIGKLYVFCFMGYCLVPFTFFNDYWEIYRSVYFMGFVFFLVI